MSKFKKLFLGILSAGIISSPFIAQAVVCLVQNGCTGTGTLPAPGQVPIGTSGSIYAPGYLTAGTNISIATSSGGISIAVSGALGSPSSTISAQGVTSTAPFVFATSGPAFISIVSDGANRITYSFSSSSLNLGSFLTASAPTATITAQGTTASSPFTFATSGPLMSITTNGAGTVTFTHAATSTILAGYSTSTGANPTAVIGSAAVNGTANTFMRSDAAPAFNTSTAWIMTSGWQFVGTGISSTQLTSQSSTLKGSTTFPGLTINSFAFINSLGVLTTTSTPSGGGAGTPAGVSNDVQINAGGAFGADAGGFFQYQTSTHRLWLSQVTSSVFIGSNSDFATSSVFIASSTTFSYTGATSSWTIPSGVTSITINVQGSASGPCNASTGGGSSTGTLSVTAGQVYYYAVGGKATGPSAGGYPGGGTTAASNQDGCGGAGMSWFSASSSFNTSTVIIVAGGAGGGVNQAGGFGGGATGTVGTAAGAGLGGAGGTQTAGGAGGGSDNGAGNAGTEGQGGAGLGVGDATNGAGGGGGGFFGGGSGGGAKNGNHNGGGGGGGSGFLKSTLTATSTSQNANAATGTINISYQIPGGETVFSTSTAALYVGGHIFTGNQNAVVPTVGSCGANPAITGNDTAGLIYVGSGVITSCTMTFGQRYSNPPACTANDNTSILAVRPLTTTSTLVLSSVSTFAGDTISYHCLDY